MSSVATLILPKSSAFDSSLFLSNPRCQLLSSSHPKDMWRTFFRRVCRPYPPSPSSLFSEFSFSKLSFSRRSEGSCFLLGNSPYHAATSPASFKGFASVAEAVEAISSTDVDEDASSIHEIHGFLQEISSREKAAGGASVGRLRKQLRTVHPVIGSKKYLILRRKQIKIETDAWFQAAQEYKELLADMCERKLVPNLPYMKSLFLGWFEPFRDKIVAEQELCRESKSRASLFPFFNELPPEMMAVITMHKLTSFLMTGEDGCIRVVQASCQIGDAIEHEFQFAGLTAALPGLQAAFSSASS
ncbi:hypothetical protein KSP40_PGU012111 [Platanthera guangdongensis]|uniref:DNA-directed RNA polymerase N-terminal domain-containing protein n=1 Tax=Platanthera guangdongensis TaxID=2320717 RepID=A0ABR2MKY7_9ASPA